MWKQHGQGPWSHCKWLSRVLFQRANFAPVSVNSSIVIFFIQFPRDRSLWKVDKRWNSFLECGRSLYNSCRRNANLQVSLAAVIIQTDIFAFLYFHVVEGKTQHQAHLCAHTLGSRRGSFSLLPFPCAQLCAPLIPSTQVPSLVLAAEQVLLMNLAEICDFFFPFLFPRIGVLPA